MEQDAKTRLMKRLDENLQSYISALMAMSKQEIIEKSAEISAMIKAHSFMKNSFSFYPDAAETLLGLENPLKYLSSVWLPDMELSDLGDLTDLVTEAIDKLEDPEQEEQRSASLPKNKSSVRDQLRNTAQEAGQRPPTERKSHRDEAR